MQVSKFPWVFPFGENNPSYQRELTKVKSFLVIIHIYMDKNMISFPGRNLWGRQHWLSSSDQSVTRLCGLRLVQHASLMHNGKSLILLCKIHPSGFRNIVNTIVGWKHNRMGIIIWNGHENIINENPSTSRKPLRSEAKKNRE